MAYTFADFQASLFGPKFPELTEPQFDFAAAMAASELAQVLCFCPDLYPHAMSIKIALILQGMGMGTIADSSPVLASPSGKFTAYLVEDEVFDTRRKYQLKENDGQTNGSDAAGMLAGIIGRCKSPLKVGALLARGINQHFGCCKPFNIGDKAEWNHGGQ